MVSIASSMPSPARTAETPVTLAVPGADLCLDFANTRYWRGSPQPTAQRATPADFLCLGGGARDAGVFSARVAGARGSPPGAPPHRRAGLEGQSAAGDFDVRPSPCVAR